MEVEQQALLQAWWTKSCHDLAAVRLLLAAEPPALDIAVYHCQQAAEKAIKAWLVWKEVPFPKTHDLNRLLGLCAPLEPAFENLRPHGTFLNPFAVEFRYPGEVSEPTREDAFEGLHLAAEVLDFVKQHCPFLA